MNYYCVLAMFISIFIATILVAPSTMANYIEAGKLSNLKFLTLTFFTCACSKLLNNKQLIKFKLHRRLKSKFYFINHSL